MSCPHASLSPDGAVLLEFTPPAPRSAPCACGQQPSLCSLPGAAYGVGSQPTMVDPPACHLPRRRVSSDLLCEARCWLVSHLIPISSPSERQWPEECISLSFSVLTKVELIERGAERPTATPGRDL